VAAGAVAPPAAGIHARRRRLAHELFVPVGGITPQHLAAYATADANGFGAGSALYKPGRDVTQGNANALGISTGLVRDHRVRLDSTGRPPVPVTNFADAPDDHMVSGCGSRRAWTAAGTGASLRHLLLRRQSPNEGGRPPTSPCQCARLNRPVRKTGRNLNNPRGLPKARHPNAGTSPTLGMSSTGF
jgi:hypothetical protein